MTHGKTVFVTGGAGYIGSHCIVELLNANYNVIAIDNFTNSIAIPDGTSAALKRVETITGKKVTFYMIDLLDKDAITKVFEKVKFFTVFSAILFLIQNNFFPSSTKSIA